MTDRGQRALRQSETTFVVGPSHLQWSGKTLLVDVDEWAAPPIPGRVQGQIRLYPDALSSDELPLTPDGCHIWRPFAPSARIEVDLNRGVKWAGHGYFDANFGTRALEQDFSYWTWARFPTDDGAVAFYDADRLDGSTLSAAVHFDRNGTVTPIALPDRRPMARSLWMVRRDTRGDANSRPTQTKAMLDAPFYCRSVVRTQLGGRWHDGVHEALDLRRFRQPWLKPMIAMRVPRRPGWQFADP